MLEVCHTNFESLPKEKQKQLKARMAKLRAKNMRLLASKRKQKHMLKYIKCDPDFKYQSRNELIIDVPELAGYECQTHDIELKDGTLKIAQYKYWNGTSGPTIDTKKSKVPSLTHDSLCELIELGLLPPECLPVADRIFYRLCKERKMWWLKSRAWFRGLKWFSWLVVRPKKIKILEAP
jgi:hypothetical protein